jgi:Protein of unknown function (DUF2370)
MSSGRYAPIPNAQEAIDAERQMEDAFDVSDDEDGERTSETRPMISPLPASGTTSNLHNNNNPTNANLYNFEYDYTMPPPGSPPRPSARALPNNVFGNSNGYVPDSNGTVTVSPRSRNGWIQRTLAPWLPASLAQAAPSQQGAIGGGNGNDGVFANVTAKPTASVANDLSRAEQGSSNAHIVPEFEQKDVPPTYADAQMDAVPPYWDTTVLTPAGIGEDLMVEGFPPGHVFAFVTSFFISFSFQFIGEFYSSLNQK